MVVTWVGGYKVPFNGLLEVFFPKLFSRHRREVAPPSISLESAKRTGYYGTILFRCIFRCYSIFSAAHTFFWRYRSWQCSPTEFNVTFSRISVHSVPWKRHCVINFFGLMLCLTSFFPAVEESLALTMFWGWCAAAHNVSIGHQIYSVSV